MGRGPDWSNLVKELATKIAEHIEWRQDFESFSRVCSRWRSATKEATFRACIDNNPSSLSPLLLLPEGNENSSQRRLFSLSKRMVRHLNLPNLLTNEALAPIKLLSSHGWLLMDTGKSRTTHIPVLLNPMLGTAIALPSISFQNPLFWRIKDDDYGPHLFHKFILSANPATTSDFTVVLSVEDPNAYGPYHYSGYGPILMFWNKGDDEWSHLKTLDYRFWKNPCEDIAYYQGDLYGVLKNGEILKFGTEQGCNYYRVVGKFSAKKAYKYLVESAGKLLIVVRYLSNRYLTKKIEVFEFDSETVEFEPMQSLGSRSIFIGSNSSFSLDVTHAPGFKPNCVYYTHDHVTDVFRGSKCSGEDNGVYNLMNAKTTALHLSSETYFELTPLTWVESF